MALYSPADFIQSGIDLKFIKSTSPETLSIIHTMFHKNQKEIQEELKNYELKH